MYIKNVDTFFIEESHDLVCGVRCKDVGLRPKYETKFARMTTSVIVASLF